MAFYQRNYRLLSSYFLIKSPKMRINSFEIFDSMVNLKPFGGYVTVSQIDHEIHEERKQQIAYNIA